MALTKILSALGEAHQAARPEEPKAEEPIDERKGPEGADDGGDDKARHAPRKASRGEDLAFRVGQGLVDDEGDAVELGPDPVRPRKRPRPAPDIEGDAGTATDAPEGAQQAPDEGTGSGSPDGEVVADDGARRVVGSALGEAEGPSAGPIADEDVPDAQDEGPVSAPGAKSIGGAPAGTGEAGGTGRAERAGRARPTNRTPCSARKHLRDRVRRQAQALDRARDKVERLLAENEGLRNQVTDGRGECARLRAALEDEREARQATERERDRLSTEILDREQAEAERRAQALGLDGRTRTTLPVPTSAATGAPIFFGSQVGIMGQRGYQKVEVDKIQYDRSGGIMVSDRNGIGGFVGSWKEDQR